MSFERIRSREEARARRNTDAQSIRNWHAIARLSVNVAWKLHPKNAHPVLNFRVLINRALSASLFLFVALGFGWLFVPVVFALVSPSILLLRRPAKGIAPPAEAH